MRASSPACQQSQRPLRRLSRRLRLRRPPRRLLLRQRQQQWSRCRAPLMRQRLLPSGHLQQLRLHPRVACPTCTPQRVQQPLRHRWLAGASASFAAASATLEAPLAPTQAAWLRRWQRPHLRPRRHRLWRPLRAKPACRARAAALTAPLPARRAPALPWMRAAAPPLAPACSRTCSARALQLPPTQLPAAKAQCTAVCQQAAALTTARAAAPAAAVTRSI